MGIYVIRVPDIGEGIAEVELVAWHVQPGDSITEDQLVADVMTDKATVEVPSPMHGKVIAVGGAVGEVLAVGSELLRLEVDGPGNLKEGEAAAAVAAPAPAAPPAAAPAPAAPPAAAPAAAPAATGAPGKGVYVIRVPDIGEGIAEVELVAWHVQPGDPVTEDQLVADVMTDKATVEVPSPVHGKVLAHGGAVGTVLAVGSELVRLEVDGPGNLKDDGAAAATPAAAPATTAAPAPAPAAPKAAPAPTPAAAPKPAPARSAARAPITPRKEGERPLASPAVRRRALDIGVDLRLVHGSGPAGRIGHEDLDAWVASGGQVAVAGASPYVERHGEEAIPVIGLRRRIAQKMQDAKRRIPHFSYVEEVDVTELEALRGRLNARHGAARGRLTVLPFLVRAMVLALRDFPQVNARFDDDAGVVTRYEPVHLGIATQTANGLMVPVLRHAESLDLWACAAGIARVAEGARSGKAAREELSGSTITLTSLGALGGIVSTPVINHPEVAIVGVNRMIERPMLQGGQVVARLLMNLSSSFDHRVVDGMDAAEFIQAMRALLETPALLFVE